MQAWSRSGVLRTHVLIDFNPRCHANMGFLLNPTTPLLRAHASLAGGVAEATARLIRARTLLSMIRCMRSLADHACNALRREVCCLVSMGSRREPINVFAAWVPSKNRQSNRTWPHNVCV